MSAKRVKEEPIAQPVLVEEKVVSRKIGADELIPLQKEGKLKGYDPLTGIGQVAKDGNAVDWPTK